MYPFAILIGGPTATQKTRLAYEIQKKLPSIIINSDSMQVYNDLASLTNAPSKEEIREYSCKLFKFMEYPEKCNVGLWFTNVLKVLSQTKEKIPIFVGGTGKTSLSIELSKILKKKFKRKYSRKSKNYSDHA